MNRSVRRTLIALRDPMTNSNNLTLILATKKQNEDILSGRLLEFLVTSEESDVVYSLKQVVEFKKKQVLWSNQIVCREEKDKNKVIIDKEVLKQKLNSMESEQSEQIRLDKDYNQEGDDQDDSGDQNLRKRRGRPKGSKNRKRQGNQNNSYSDSDEDQEKKRGRGRPKGSRNKRSQEDETSSLRDVKNLLSKHLRNGDMDSAEEEDKTKIKNLTKIEPTIEDGLVSQIAEKQKRSRGRPKGVKNKPKFQPQNSEQSDDGEEYTLPLPIQSNIETVQCCFRCSNRKLKQSLSTCTQNVFKKILSSANSDPKNLWLDFSMQNRTNIVLQCIRKNIDPAIFELLLTKLKSFQPYFICSWEYEGRIQKLFYTVKTNKTYLSQTGKEGNNALLHDCDIKPQIWWKQIGVQRILESMTNNTDKKIIQLLKNYDKDLKKEIEQNIPTLIRCGNYQIARYLLEAIVPNGYAIYGYSREHLDCLNEKNPNLHFKKINVLKQNFGGNFSCPIHCASINPNPKLLQNLLKSLHDYNVSDNLSRKPVHYAALAKTTANLQILVDNKSDLKQTDKQRVTPLMVAAMNGKHENLAFILQKVPDHLYINFRCKQGLSALHYAVINQHLECVKVLVNNKLVEVSLQARDRLTALHFAAGTGNIQILKQLINAGHPIDRIDRYKRTPLFFAIRNNNNGVSFQLLKQGAKYYKKDTSLNSLLHYCAAYGNTVFLQHLLPHLQINKNKRGYYPWEIAVGKGHMGCIKILSKQEKKLIDGPSEHNMCFLNMKNIRYTTQAMNIINYLIDNHYVAEEVDINGSRLLHYVCSIGEQDYIKYRQIETGKNQKDNYYAFKQQYEKLQKDLIVKLEEKQSCADVENKRGETPVSLCIQKQNMVGLRLLLKQHLNLQFQSSKGFTLLHYFSYLSSQGLEGIKFVLERLQPREDKKAEERNKLRDAMKKTDINGFESILFFVKDFTFSVKSNFNQRVKILRQNGMQAVNAQTKAFQQFKEHQKLFVKLLCLMVDFGCDANVLVQERRRDDEGQNFKKWGILHFLMKFPSLVLLDLFRNRIKIRDFNAANSNGMTPLHLFCQQIRYGCLFQVDLGVDHEDYRGQKSLQFLLQNGCGPNNIDTNRSSPLLYAALNKQIQFIILLRRFGSSINNCNNCNQVPFIEIIKMKNYFTFSNIETLLTIGADPNSEDLNKQTALHHLVHNSMNLDNSTEICKLFFSYGAKINSLDKYQRTPLFYCFTKIDGDDDEEPTHDKVEILQALLKHSDIDINHKDVFQRTALHYACEKNYFFSILYLLDKSIDINVKDFEGNTPLAVCLKHKTLNQAALLIKRGVSEGYVVDGEVKLSYFAYAITKLSVGICYMLLDHGYPIQKALQQVPNQEFKNLLQKKYGKKK